MSTATLSPVTITAAATVTSGHQRRARRSVNYVTGLNSFNGLKAQNNKVVSLGVPESAEQSFGKIVMSLRKSGNGGGCMAAKCSAAAEIFRIAAIMNGLTLVGVAVGFVLLRIEAYVEETE